MSIDRELRNSLRDTGEHLIIRPGSLDDVRRRGRRRRTARRAVVSTCAVLVGIGGGVVGLRALDDRSSTELVVGTEDPVVTDVEGDAAVGDVTGTTIDGIDGATSIDVTWEPVTASSVLGYRRSFDNDSGAFAALSTAPGPPNWEEFDQRSFLYRSADGVDWDAIEVPQHLGLTDIGFVDGALVAVGTAASLSAVDPGLDPGRLVIVHPDDGWRIEELPLDIEAAVPEFARIISAQATVAEIDGATIVVASVSSYLDPEELLRGTRSLAENEWANIEGDSVVVVRWVDTAARDTVPPTAEPSVDGSAEDSAIAEEYEEYEEVPEGYEEIVARYTLAELGVSDADLERINGTPPVVYADDGSGFVEVATLGTGAASGIDLVSNDRGAVLTVSTDTGDMLAYASTDGRTWDAVDLGAGWIYQIEAGGAGIVAGIGAQQPTATVKFSPDGRDWIDVDLIPGGESYVTSVVVGDDVMAVSVDQWLDPVAERGGVSVALENGLVLRLLDQGGAAVVLDEAGTVVHSFDNVYAMLESSSGTTVTLDNGAEIVLSEQLFELAYEQIRADGGPTAVSRVFISRDGATWTGFTSDEVFGRSDVVGVAVQAVTPAGVIARGSVLTDPDGDRAGLPPVVALARVG